MAHAKNHGIHGYHDTMIFLQPLLSQLNQCQLVGTITKDSYNEWTG